MRFNSLDKEQMVKIVEKFIFEVQSKLESQGVSLEISNDVIKHLAEVGFDPKNGGQDLWKDVFFEKISTPISKVLIDLQDKKSKK